MASKLAPREAELLKLLVQGQSNKEIATNMRISCATVKQYMRSLFLKFSVSNRTQLAISAMSDLMSHTAVAADGQAAFSAISVVHASTWPRAAEATQPDVSSDRKSSLLHGSPTNSALKDSPRARLPNSRSAQHLLP